MARSAVTQKYSDILGCQQGSFPCCYLGFPLMLRNLTNVEWADVTSKMDMRLASWQGQLMSRAGRLILLNSVLTALSAYFFTVFPMLEREIRQIDKRRRNFLSVGDGQGKKGRNLVNWRTVVLKKEQGGLGMLDLKLHSMSRLLQWAWNVITK